MIGEHERHGLRVDQLERALAVVRREDRELAAERELEDPEILRLVVDVEDRDTRGNRAADQAWVSRSRSPTGSRTVKVVPRPGADSTSIEPPWSITIRRLIESPRPVPLPASFVE